MPPTGPRGHVRRERDRRVSSWAVKKRETKVPTRSMSSGEGDMGWGATLPPRLLVMRPLPHLKAWLPY
jgi:hypothetical protein